MSISVSENGRTIFAAGMITRSGEVFHLRGLMSSGNSLGDGSERGPDGIAEALHVMAVGIVQHHLSQMPECATQFKLQAAEERFSHHRCRGMEPDLGGHSLLVPVRHILRL